MSAPSESEADDTQTFAKRWAFVLRLGAWYALFFFVASVLLSYLGFRFLRQALIQEDLEFIKAQAYEYKTDALGEPDRDLENYFSQTTRSLLDIVYVRVRGPGIERLVTDYDLKDRHAIESEPIRVSEESQKNRVRLAGMKRRSIPVRTFTFQLDESTSIEVAHNESAHNRLLEAYLSLSQFAVLPIVLIGLVGGAIFTKWSLQPVRKVNAAIRQILSSGSFEQRVSSKSDSGEIGDLVGLCNRLLAHSERLMNSMRQALDNVAHDLRTPLARLKASAETALQQEGEPNAQSEALADCLEESDQILAQLNTLMDVAAAESDILKLKLVIFPVTVLSERLTDLFEFVAEEKNITIRSIVSPGLEVRADLQRMLQLLGNLIDNAIKYTPDGGHIVLSARAEGENAIFAVKDDGIGIAPHEQERIWERLYRSDVSRHQEGLGLGLNMVRAIALAHGGEIKLSSQPGVGSEFVLTIPRGC